MAEDKVRHPGIIVLGGKPQAVHIVNQVLPAVFPAEVAQGFRLAAVAQVGMPHHHKASLCQHPCRCIVAVNMLCHAVHQLNHSLGGSLPFPQTPIQLLPGYRTEDTLFHGHHTIRLLRENNEIIYGKYTMKGGIS